MLRLSLHGTLKCEMLQAHLLHVLHDFSIWLVMPKMRSLQYRFQYSRHMRSDQKPALQEFCQAVHGRTATQSGPRPGLGEPFACTESFVESGRECALAYTIARNLLAVRAHFAYGLVSKSLCRSGGAVAEKQNEFSPVTEGTQEAGRRRAKTRSALDDDARTATAEVASPGRSIRCRTSTALRSTPRSG